MLSKLKNKLYYYFAEKNWGVRREYGPYVDAHPEEHAKQPWKHWWMLFRLNWHYRVLRRRTLLLTPQLTAEPIKTEPVKRAVTGPKTPPRVYPESKLLIRPTVESLVEDLSQYDIISFDIFDTLIFRPFATPTDVFYLLEAENGLFNFKELRIQAEQKARQKTSKPNYEVDVFDIYQELGKYYSIDTVQEAKREIETEKQICYANPFMREVYCRLLQAGKRIIAVSDMYIPEVYIKEILGKCGYCDIERVFVSCDHGVNKISSKLQRKVSKELGTQYNYVHIGDNYRSDVEASQQAGWTARHYRMCCELGNRFRPHALTSPVSSMYKAIVNNHIHCGVYEHSEVFEFGYIYAGILTGGFCEWITEFCRSKGCDKIMFMARDMDIFFKVYQKHYNEIPSEYAKASRFALQQLIFEGFTQEYIFHTVQSRCDKDKTIRQLLEETDMVLLEKYAGDYSLFLEEKLTHKNLELVSELIYEHKADIIAYFADSDRAARAYFKEKIGNAKKVCVADLGWRGSEIAYLKYLIEEKWKLDVEVVGVVFGSTLSDCARSLISRGVVTSYAYNNTVNRDFLRNHNWEIEYINLLLIESIFTSEEPSLIKYVWDKENQRTEFITYDENPNCEITRELQNGILTFMEEFAAHRDPIKQYYPLSAVDAFEAMHKILSNYPYMARTLGDIKDTPYAIAGFYPDLTYVPIGELMLDRKLITNWPIDLSKGYIVM